MNSIVERKHQYVFFNAITKKKLFFDFIDEKWHFEFPHSIVSIGKKKGVINSKGEIIIPIIYDELYSWENCFNVVLKGKEGIIDNCGNIIVDLKYDGIYGIYDDKMFVSLNDKLGLVTTNDEIVIPIIFDELQYFTADVLPARINDKWGVFNSNGKTIVPIYYDDVSYFDTDDYLPVKLNNKWGCIDANGDLIIPLKYDNPISFVRKYNERLEYASACLNGKYGVIDRNGVEIIPFIYDFIETHYVDVIIVQLNGKSGVVNNKGEIVIPIKFDVGHGRCGSIRLLKGVGFKVELNGKVGLMNSKGKYVVSVRYDSLYDIDNGLFKVQLNENFGVINEKEEIILPIIYNRLYASDTAEEDSNYFIAKINEKEGIITQSGKIVIDFVYDSISDFAEGLFLLIKNEKFGIADTKGGLIDPDSYINNNQLLEDFCKSTLCNEFLARMNASKCKKEDQSKSFHILRFGQRTMNNDNTNKYALIDNLGNIVLYPEYDEISVVDEGTGCFILRRDKMIDVIDVNGNSVL